MLAYTGDYNIYVIRFQISSGLICTGRDCDASCLSTRQDTEPATCDVGIFRAKEKWKWCLSERPYLDRSSSLESLFVMNADAQGCRFYRRCSVISGALGPCAVQGALIGHPRKRIRMTPNVDSERCAEANGGRPSVRRRSTNNRAKEDFALQEIPRFLRMLCRGSVFLLPAGSNWLRAANFYFVLADLG